MLFNVILIFIDPVLLQNHENQSPTAGFDTHHELQKLTLDE